MNVQIHTTLKPHLRVLAAMLPLLAMRWVQSAPESRPSVTVKPAIVEDQRNRWFDPQVRDMSGARADLEVQLRLEGEDLRYATTYANVRVDEAVDDLGTRVTPPVPRIRVAAQATRIPMVLLEEGHAPSVLVRVLLGGASRDATRIAHLKGQVQVYAGTQSTAVTLPKLKDAIGTRILNSPLDELHARITLLGGPNLMSLSMAGDTSVLRKVQAVDADGTVLAKSESPAETNSPLVLSLPREVDNDMSVQFIVWTNARLFTVPFDLKDIVLP